MRGSKTVIRGAAITQQNRQHDGRVPRIQRVAVVLLDMEERANDGVLDGGATAIGEHRAPASRKTRLARGTPAACPRRSGPMMRRQDHHQHQADHDGQDIPLPGPRMNATAPATVASAGAPGSTRGWS